MGKEARHRGNGGYNGRGLQGKVPELGRNVYVYGTPNQGDKFIKTTEAIADYVGREMSKSMMLLVKGKESPPKEPVQPKPKKGEEDNVGFGFATKKYEKEVSHYLYKMDKYIKDKAKVFMIILGQCMLAMKTQIESLPNYKKLADDDDVIKLIAAINWITSSS